MIPAHTPGLDILTTGEWDSLHSIAFDLSMYDVIPPYTRSWRCLGRRYHHALQRPTTSAALTRRLRLTQSYVRQSFPRRVSAIHPHPQRKRKRKRQSHAQRKMHRRMLSVPAPGFLSVHRRSLEKNSSLSRIDIRSRAEKEKGKKGREGSSAGQPGLNITGALIFICQNVKFSSSFLQNTYLGLAQAITSTMRTLSFWYFQRYFKISTKKMFVVINVVTIRIPFWGMLGIWTHKIGYEFDYQTYETMCVD
ncbi:hypothetical protein CVT25_012987 [Psilocybe cyanescens]|uniref:Autophagy-related protein n=1 Tax=Psilocybe cyanescens TaxID=93625 RepID=A0A409XHM0_PSICY|nr:hypothetical protein CVT25_012987 [Psilocybe cyanescens]